MWSWLLGVCLAGDLLAPTLPDLDASLDQSERLLDEVGEAEHRLAAAQAAWLEAGCERAACARPVAIDVAAGARGAGQALRDRLQSARAELVRAERIAAFAPLRPLVDPARLTRLDALRDRVDRALRAYLARSAWAAAWIEPALRRLGVGPAPCVVETP